MPHKDRETRNAYMRAYHARNPAPQRERVAVTKRRVRAENTEIVAEAKARPCADCGGTFPTCVMDFDHVRGVKLFDIGARSRVHVSKPKLLLEIAKCDVVCSNCHRIRTHIGRSTGVVGSTPTPAT